ARRPCGRPHRPAWSGRRLRGSGRPRAARADLRSEDLGVARRGGRCSRRQRVRLPGGDGDRLRDVRLDRRRRRPGGSTYPALDWPPAGAASDRRRELTTTSPSPAKATRSTSTPNAFHGISRPAPSATGGAVAWRPTATRSSFSVDPATYQPPTVRSVPK